MNKYFSYQGQKYPYILKIRKQKNIVLNIKEGKIQVSAPHWAEDWEIERLIYKNISKIIQIINFYQVNLKLNLYTKKDDYFIYIFDKKYPVHLTKENIHAKFVPDKGYIFKDYEDIELTKKKIYNFLKVKYYDKFEKLLINWAKIMQLNYDNLSLKIMTRTWGICYPAHKKIVLNIKLIHFDLSIIEYVIVHELSHLVHSNHSKSFWSLVESYIPDYRERMSVLKKAAV